MIKTICSKDMMISYDQNNPTIHILLAPLNHEFLLKFDDSMNPPII